ncbi:MAG: bifunctional pyr operon transcriptional regulator/uracil phosphoribosyltransferase PyrR [Oscillospiraceae bacterium]
MMCMRIIMDEAAINRAIARISYEIIETNKGAANLCSIGILTRGIGLANRIAKKIKEIEGTDIPVGCLDITNFRDDKIEKDTVDKSQINFSIENKIVVLVDDVIFTGRSVRAAFDAITKKGRPSKLELAVLVDRGHRELPIRADFIGKNLPTSKNEKVKVQITEFDSEDKVYLTRL